MCDLPQVPWRTEGSACEESAWKRSNNGGHIVTQQFILFYPSIPLFSLPLPIIPVSFIPSPLPLLSSPLPPSLSLSLSQILRKAVNGMLPKNILRKKRMRRLHLFPDSDHPYSLNITHELPGPCPVYKRLEEYSPEEVAAFPDIVRVPHMWYVYTVYHLMLTVC